MAEEKAVRPKKTAEEKRKDWFDKIKEGLLQHNVSLEEFLTIYKYTGGDGNRLKDDDDRDSQQDAHIAYWVQTRGLWSKYPDWVNACICGHWIQENCYVVNINDDNKLIPLGNCCIKRFLGDKSGRTCDKCEAPHVNRKYNLCNKCKPQSGQNKCEKCNECCKKPNKLCITHLRLKILEEAEENRIKKEKEAEENRIKQEKAHAEMVEWTLKRKIEMDKERERRLRMMDDDERKCDCGKLIEYPFTQCYNCKRGIDPNATRPCETCKKPVKGGFKTCYNCNKGIDPNATHPCETCEKPVKGTFPNCYLCNQKLRKEKG
jgi:hypothetical protein